MRTGLIALLLTFSLLASGCPTDEPGHDTGDDDATGDGDTGPADTDGDRASSGVAFILYGGWM